MNITEFLVGFAPTLFAGSTLVLGVGVCAMLLSRSLIQRKRFATTTLFVFLGWVALAILPMRRPLTEMAPGLPPIPLPSVVPMPSGSSPVSVAPLPAPTRPASGNPVVTTEGATAQTNDDAGVAEVAMSIVALGSLLSGAYLVLASLVLRRRIRRARVAPPRVLRLAQELGFDVNRLRILVADEPTRPFCFGLRTPTIVLSADLCEPGCRERLRAVLLHELCHITDQDLRDQVLLAVCLPVLYWHPLFWVLRHRLRLSAEMLADDRATQKVDRKTYVRELIELIDHPAKSLPLAPVLPVLGLQSEFYRRMNMLLNRKRPLTTSCSTTHTVLRRCSAALVLTAMTLSWGTQALMAQRADEPQERATDRSTTKQQAPKTTKKNADTYRYKITGTYPSPSHLERMLISVERSEFSMSGLRVKKGMASSAGTFWAILQCDAPKPGHFEKLMSNMLQLRNDLHALGITIDHLGPDKHGLSPLGAEQAKIARHTSAILAVTQHPSTWTKTLDELITLFADSANRAGDRHLAWLNSVQIRGSRDGKTGASLVAPGNSAGDDIRKLANLYDDVKRLPFFAQVQSMSLPSGVKKIMEDRDPAKSFSFAWKFRFHPARHPLGLPGRPGGAAPKARVTARDLRARYRTLMTLVSTLSRASEQTRFTRKLQGLAARKGISIDRFVPVRGSGATDGLHRVSYQYHFAASLWQAMEMLSFVENQERLYRVHDFNLSPGTAKSGKHHRCRLTIETFVYKPDPDLEARFGGGDIERRTLVPGYKFMGQKGRRDIFVDPRRTTDTKSK